MSTTTTTSLYDDNDWPIERTTRPHATRRVDARFVCLTDFFSPFHPHPRRRASVDSWARRCDDDGGGGSKSRSVATSSGLARAAAWSRWRLKRRQGGASTHWPAGRPVVTYHGRGSAFCLDGGNQKVKSFERRPAGVDEPSDVEGRSALSRVPTTDTSEHETR